jgi:Holliday junction resolvase RusA-like endonuclease
MVDIDSRHFVLAGKPLPKERPRLFRGRAITPAKTLDFERRLRESYLAAHGRKPVFTDDVEFDLLAAMPNRTHGDLDNIVKMIDGLNGIAWLDDKQVKKFTAHMIFDKANPRLELTIRPYQLDQQ